jgi:hypothetical protein
MMFLNNKIFCNILCKDKVKKNDDVKHENGYKNKIVNLTFWPSKRYKVKNDNLMWCDI